MYRSFPLKLSTAILSSTLLSASLIAISPARAFNQNDVDRFVSGVCTNCDISGANLSNIGIEVLLNDFVNATGTLFNNSQLIGTTIPGFFGGLYRTSNFTSADFSGATLARISFLDSLFNGANFSASLQRSTSYDFNDFTGANFTGALLGDVRFSDSNLTGTNFTGAGLSFVRFSNSNLTGTNFTNARLRDVFFFNNTNAPLSLALFSNLTPQNTVTGTNLTGAIFTDALVEGSSFENADFTDAILDGSTFQNVNLLGANITPQQLNSLAFFSGILPDGTEVVVPEPSVVLGLLAVGGIGFLSRRKSR